MKPTCNDQNLNSYFEKEFEVLSQAHFQTSQKTTSFFQYITIIFIAPFAFFANPNIGTNATIAVILLVIGLLGFLITMYLADLRFESLLYARAVNKVRYSLYCKSVNRSSPDNQITDINHNSILIAQSRIPKYFDTNQFLWIVLALGLIDSFYITYGMRVISQVVLEIFLTKILFLGIAIIISGIHVLCYWIKSRSHENGSIYFKKSLGVDIDGVISDQNAQFVKYYNMNSEEQITQEDIVTIPVHKSGLITIEDERKVFHKAEYWETLRVLQGAKGALSQLRNNGYKISLITSRPWILPDGKLHSLTRKWLKRHQIEYNHLYFDNKKSTRFDKVQSKRIKYFVEDDLNNARKLCSICKAVFLVDYKYNQYTGELPYNLIRIKNLGEVVDFINHLD